MPDRSQGFANVDLIDLGNWYLAEFRQDMELQGRAEGLVDGHRRTLPLTLSKGAQAGAYGVRNEWGAKGTWSVLLTATQPSPRGSIQAVVDVGPDGSVARVTLPQRMQTTADVDRNLRARAGAALTVGRR